MAIRRFPWPYKAALSFSNDCDFLSAEAMLALHRFFAEPPSDGGLGLELSDSFFFFCHNFIDTPTYAYFDKLSLNESPHAGLIRDLVRLGYLDTIHTWGDFTSGGFNRRRAQKALDAFTKAGLTVPCWSNHGGGMNVQGIGEKDFYTYHQGDEPGNVHYHLDLLDALGVRYYALSRDRTWNFVLEPGGHLATEIRRKAPTRVWRNPLVKVGEAKQSTTTMDKKNVFTSTRTRAGNELQSFVRYDAFLEGGGDFPAQGKLRDQKGRRVGPNIGRIGHALSNERLDALVKAGGVSIVYQHLSTVRFEPKRWLLTSELELHPQNAEDLKRLAAYHAKGDVWVAAQAILLNYLYMINTIKAEVLPGTTDVVRIKVTVPPSYENRGFAGLTVSVPKGTTRCEFILPDRNIIKGTIAGIDDPDGPFAMLPVARLPKVDWRALARENSIACHDAVSTCWKPEWGEIWPQGSL